MRGSQNSSLGAVMEGDGFRLMVTHLRLEASEMVRHSLSPFAHPVIAWHWK
jgi:hypothetical protein